VAAVAAAQPAPPKQGPQKLLADYLQLSDQQIAEWNQIQQDTAATVKPLADTIRSLEDQLHAALQAATPDANAVGKLVIQIEQTRAQIHAAQDAADAKRVATLNADQKIKYRAFQAAMQFLEQHRPGRPGPGPSGE
jgi:Spy/CpxP family protein refolding chaperone